MAAMLFEENKEVEAISMDNISDAKLNPVFFEIVGFVSPTQYGRWSLDPRPPVVLRPIGE